MSRRGWSSISFIILSCVVGFVAYLVYFLPQETATQSMLQRLQQLSRSILPSVYQTRNMTTANGLPPSWHSGPGDGFHGKITEDGPFKPERERYHLYVCKPMGRTLLLDTTADAPTASPDLCLTQLSESEIAPIGLRPLLTLLPFCFRL